MKSRRDNRIAFLFLVVACGVGYLASTHSGDEMSTRDLSTYEMPDLNFVIEAPFEFPYPLLEFKRRVAPSLAISSRDGFESILIEVRSTLLESAKPQRVRSVDTLVVSADSL